MSSLNAIKNSKHHFTRIIQSLQKLTKAYKNVCDGTSTNFSFKFARNPLPLT